MKRAATMLLLAQVVLAGPLHMLTSPSRQPSAGPGGRSLHAAFRDADALRDLIKRLPKAELHVHIEGTLEPELMFKLASKNGIALPYDTVEAAKVARENYTCLEDFLGEYFAATKVLMTEDDFYSLARAYLDKAESENVAVAEIFFDPQGHIARGVTMETIVKGLSRALTESDVAATLVLCAQREFSAASAVATLTRAIPYLPAGVIIALGLDGAEGPNPPRKYMAPFAEATVLRLHKTAHAGEEGGPAYVREALNLLGVERIDHGIRSIEDPDLVAEMIEKDVAITLCPMSNLLLQVYAGQLEDKLREVLASGLRITINSDDPAYFGAYVAGNFEYVAGVAGLGPDELAQLAANSFEASFLPKERKDEYVRMVWEALDDWKDDNPAPQQRSRQE